MLGNRTVSPSRWIYILLGVVLIPVIAVACLFVIGVHRPASTNAYKDGLEIAQSSPEVQEAIGTGIKANGLPLGLNFRFRNTEFVEWSVRLSGSHGQGNLCGVANRIDGWWEFSRLVFVTDNGKTRIDLNKSPRRTPLPEVKSQNVYLIPIELSKNESLEWAPVYYKAKFGIDVHVLPIATWDPALRDKKRNQIDAVKAIDFLNRSYPDLARDPYSILIAVTSEDIFTSYFNWTYAENWRAEGRFAVVSSARLHPPSWLDGWNPEWLNSRLQKMLSKNIAVLYFDLPLSDDYTSLLSGGILSGLEIDEMSGQIVGVQHAWKSAINAGAPGFVVYDEPGKPAMWRRAYLDREVVEPQAQTFSTDLSSGLFIQRKTDFTLDETCPFQLVRAYTTNDQQSRAFGTGADHSLNLFLTGQMGFAVDLNMEDGGKIHFDHRKPTPGEPDAYIEPGNWSGPLTGAKAEFDGKTWRVKSSDGWTYYFPYRPGALPQYVTVLTSFQDPSGRDYKMERDQFGALLSITTPSGKWLRFDNDEQHRVRRIDSSSGRTLQYEYDRGGRLIRVTDSSGNVDAYTYDEKSQMITAAHQTGAPILVNAYLNDGYIKTQTVADAGTFQFGYFRSSRNVTTQAFIIDPHKLMTSFILYEGDNYTQSLPTPTPR